MYDAPFGAVPENIGKLVKIQIIPRVSKDSDELMLEEMVYLVGRLQAFSFSPHTGRFACRLEGDEGAVKCETRDGAIEIHLAQTYDRIGRLK